MESAIDMQHFYPALMFPRRRRQRGRLRGQRKAICRRAWRKWGGEPRVKVSATKEDTNMSTRKER